MKAHPPVVRHQAMTAGILVASLLAALAMTFLAPGAFARADDSVSDDGNLTVTVTDGSTPRPTPSVSPSPTGATSGSTSGTGAGSGGTGTSGSTGVGTGGGGTDSGAKPGEVGTAGGVYVSGVNSTAALTPDPLDGLVTVWITVRNASTAPVDATADFWMESLLFGIPLDRVEGVAIAGLQPGESRVVPAQLHGAGQWTLVNAHATVTPPETVDGVALTPLTRDATVFLFPWLLAGLAALIAIAVLVRRALRAAAAARTVEAIA
ncbi:MAG: hypothetical protein J0I43_10985 [Microbacterium sp.]|uniref:hypothetical protein n=1 Tax=Microbacterium sp. TaxID=51671 RepID=UPI001AC1C23F|nr:hypothetical protein [Microbacterium sp.]MBN9177879.1 hypothetical protein [Microbacterium sp.]